MASPRPNLLLAHVVLCAAVSCRWLQTLPGPVGAAAAAVTLLELPVAFLVLVYAPFLQRLTAMGLLALQLLRIAAGPASLANLAAAVLSFLLLDDELWVPALLRAARAMRVPLGPDVSTGQQAGGAEPLSRQSSLTSLYGECHGGACRCKLWRVSAATSYSDQRCGAARRMRC